MKIIESKTGKVMFLFSTIERAEQSLKRLETISKGKYEVKA